MRQIIAIGPGGAGKSTLAKKPGEQLELPVLHLDSLYWRPGWIESSNSDFNEKLDSILAVQNWIMDGNDSSTLPRR